MKRPSRTERKALIIQAAVGVFAEKGYTRTLMAEVASAAQIGKGTVYEYFKSKDDLFFAVFKHVIQESGDIAEAALRKAAGKSAARRLMALNSAIVSWIARHRHFYTLSMEFWAAAVSASPEKRTRMETEVRDIYERFRRIVAGIIQGGMTDGEFKKEVNSRAIAAAMVGSWDGLGVQAWFDPGFKIEKTSQAYMKLLVSGMLANR
ncbi:MAG: TetR/AcrR family transcriptional regulator [Thermodesulfobacteriota bacterium]